MSTSCTTFWPPTGFLLTSGSSSRFCWLRTEPAWSHTCMYLSDLLPAGHWGLQTSTCWLSSTPPAQTKGDRAFESVAPRLWNALPQGLRANPNPVDIFQKGSKYSIQCRQAFVKLIWLYFYDWLQSWFLWLTVTVIDCILYNLCILSCVRLFLSSLYEKCIRIKIYLLTYMQYSAYWQTMWVVLYKFITYLHRLTSRKFSFL